MKEMGMGLGIHTWRHYGVCSDSRVHLNGTFGNLYAAYIAGANGEIAIKLGSGGEIILLVE